MPINRLISIAPMMNCTDRHDRYFLRLISPNVLLYSEMITANALLFGDRNRFLEFHPSEHPVALQLGGNEPEKLGAAAKLGEEAGYDEINLNVGCPSDRVRSGQFGACLMLSPNVVAECVQAMRENVKVPVTIKCRIGVDDQDSYDQLTQFVAINAKAGCEIFIIHARKAWLKGLSPKENREIPPLRYEVVKNLKKDFPNLTFILNGGIKSLKDIKENLTDVDGVMIGRESYSNPYFLAEIEKEIFGNTHIADRHQIVENMIPYIEEQLKRKIKLSSITRHLLGLYHNQPGARAWRRFLSGDNVAKIEAI